MAATLCLRTLLIAVDPEFIPVSKVLILPSRFADEILNAVGVSVSLTTINAVELANSPITRPPIHKL